MNKIQYMTIAAIIHKLAIILLVIEITINRDTINAVKHCN